MLLFEAVLEIRNHYFQRKLEAAKSVAVGRMQLIQPKEKVPAASATLLPLLLHACPDNFNTLTYFEVSSHYVLYKYICT